jgi:LacI family transcriptional regulator
MFARTLAGRRSYQIALLYDNPSPYYINEVQSGALERCGEDGYRLIFQPCVSSSPTLTSHVIGLVAEMRVDGLILTPPVGDDQALLKELRRQNIPFVRVAPGDDQGIAPAAAMDDVAAAKEMTDYLLSLGHRRIGFIVGHPAHSASWQRLEGYKLALAAKGVRVDDALIQSGMFDFASGRKAAIELLDLDPPPSAIFASNDDMAAGALAVAHERGIGVPDQLAIAGFDNTNLAEAVWPPLTTVHQPVRALAREAADLLLSGTLDTSELRLLPYEIIVRGSTAGL